ncbi:MAG: MBL fold metallo-hydrolase [Candidatus Heimdallarchaeaceae archaeon]
MRLEIVKEVTGPLQTNAYLVYDLESKEAALFDVAGQINKLLKIIENNRLQLKWVFFTHGHFDHVMGLEKIRTLYPEAKVGIHEKEIEVMNKLGPFARLFEFDPSSFGEPDIYLEDNQNYSLGSEEMKTILAPGHTPASICFYFEKAQILISGDVLFREGVGRTDLFGGNYDKLVQSIHQLLKLPDDTEVFPGHGESTTIKHEKKYNPFI